MSQLVLVSDTLITTPAAGNLEYNGQFFGTDSNASRAQMQRIVLSTAVASTSGTSIDFTSLPAWCKKITVMFSGVSTGSNSNFLIQIGSGSIVTTGYVSAAVTVQSGAISSAAVTSTAAFVVATAGNATYLWTGTVQLVNLTGNTWVECGMLVNTTGDRSTNSGGTLALSGALDRVRITSVTPDTFDAGSINILYEG